MMSFALLFCSYLINDVTEIKILSIIYHAADPGSHIRKAQLAQDSDCRMLTEILIRDGVKCLDRAARSRLFSLSLICKPSASHLFGANLMSGC